jgi:hypothetical protein
MPIEATKHTAAGALAFAAFFVRTIDWGTQTESSAYARHYVAASCSTCTPFRSRADLDRREGKKYSGGAFTIRSVHLTKRPTHAGAEYTALVVFDVTAFRETNRNGKVVLSDVGHELEQFEESVQWTDSGWTVVDLRVSQ